MEAKIRWKDNRNLPHLDLCRPFAAHCIGYPMVTLGFGFKSYIGYRIRQRKQREVAKENEFYMQLLQQALPQEEMEKSEEQTELSDSPNASTVSIPLCKNTQQQNSSHHNQPQNASKVNSNGSIEHHHQLNGSVNTTNSKQQNLNKKNVEKENGCLQHNNHHSHNHTHHLENNHQEIIPNNAILSKSTSSKANNHLNYNNLQSGVKNTNTTSYQQIQNGIASPIKELNVPVKCSPYKNKSDDHNTYIATTNKKEYEKEKIIKDSNSSYEETSTEAPSQKVKVKSERQQQQQQQPSQQKDNQQYHQQHQSNVSANGSNLNNSNGEKNKVCEQCQRLDQDSKRLKSEVQTIKSLEQEVRQKYENIKGCLQTKQKECEDLQKQ